MQRKLTERLISSYTKLTEYERAVLATFSAAFPDSTIQWISKKERENRKERLIPADYDGTIPPNTSTEPMTKNLKTKAAIAISAQPRLFTEMSENDQNHNSTN